MSPDSLELNRASTEMIHRKSKKKTPEHTPKCKPSVNQSPGTLCRVVDRVENGGVNHLDDPGPHLNSVYKDEEKDSVQF